MHYIISPPLGSPHPLCQTILCFLGFPRRTHITIIIVVCIITVCIIIVCIIIVCIITVEEYLRCASGWSSFPEDARANHLPLNYVHSISPTLCNNININNITHTVQQHQQQHQQVRRPLATELCALHITHTAHCSVHITHCAFIALHITHTAHCSLHITHCAFIALHITHSVPSYTP